MALSGKDEDDLMIPGTQFDGRKLIEGFDNIDLVELNPEQVGPCNVPFERFAEPDGRSFKVRGKDYPTTRKKVSSDSCRLRLVAIDLYSTDNGDDRYNINEHPDSFFQKEKKRLGDKIPFTVTMSIIIPHAQNFALVACWQPATETAISDGSAFADLFNDFIDGDDDFRNSRFKLIPRIAKGSWVIKQSVGSKPVLLGNKIACPYYRADSYFEIDLDVSSSVVANHVVGLVANAVTSLTIDMGIVLQGEIEEELPEQMLCSVRLDKLSLANPQKLLPRSAEDSQSPDSLPLNSSLLE